MTIPDTAQRIIDAIDDLSSCLHDSQAWWVERDDGTYPIDRLRERIEAILREELSK